jgi:MFS transporter, ACS family, allantoate permease
MEEISVSGHFNRDFQLDTNSYEYLLHRFFEVFKDPKAYIFVFYAILVNFVGGIGIQYSLIIKDFGFNIMQTTLLNIPSGGAMIITITFSMWLLHNFPVSTKDPLLYAYSTFSRLPGC